VFFFLGIYTFILLYYNLLRNFIAHVMLVVVRIDIKVLALVDVIGFLLLD